MKKKNLKVAFIMGAQFPESIGTFRLDQIIALLSSGIDVQIFVIRLPEKPYQYQPELEKYKIMDRVHNLNIPKNRFMKVLRAVQILLTSGKKFPKLIKSFDKRKYKSSTFTLNHLFLGNHFLNSNERFDIIHCHGGQRGIMGSYLKDIGIKGKLITTFYGSDVNKYPLKYGKDCYDNLFKKSDKLIGVVNFLKNKLIKMGCPPKKVTAFPYNLRIHEFSKVRKKKPSKKYPIRIISVGRLISEKGMEFGIKAVAELSKKHKMEYLIIGDGEEKEKLQKLIKSLRLENIVKLMGSFPKKEVINHYQQSDIFIMPAIVADDGTEEAQGTVLQEAQLSYLPIVASNIGGISEGILNNKSGFLIEQKNLRQLIEKIEVLIKNPSLRKKMGGEGRMFVESKYNTEEFIKNILRTYEEALNK